VSIRRNIAARMGVGTVLRVILRGQSGVGALEVQAALIFGSHLAALQ
jgi:hypothetical protein